jgi:hypothetical protein
MLRKSLLLLCLCLSGAAVFAQSPAGGAESPAGESKWVSFTEIGTLVGNPDDEHSSPFLFHSSLNYAFHKRFSAGLGLGFDFLKETHMPVTANVMFRLATSRPVTPFLRLQAGYQVPLEDKTYRTDNYVYDPIYYADSYYPYPVDYPKMDSRGGFMANPSVGVMIHSKAGFGISLAAGYRYQKLNYKGDKNYEVNVEYNRLSLSLGIIF